MHMYMQTIMHADKMLKKNISQEMRNYPFFFFEDRTGLHGIKWQPVLHNKILSYVYTVH